MSANRKLVTWTLSVTVAALIVGAARPPEVRGQDFLLKYDDEMTVTTYYSTGGLSDQSHVILAPGGWVWDIYAEDSSRVDVSGGAISYHHTYDTSTTNVNSGEIKYRVFSYHSSVINVFDGYVNDINAYASSRINVSGGEVPGVSAYQSSRVEVTDGTVTTLSGYATSAITVRGGTMNRLYARESGTMDIYGAAFNELRAYDTSIVTFHALDFDLGDGLTLDGERILGTGILSGHWFDGTPWSVDVHWQEPDAQILAVPEPATLALLAVGLSAVFIRRRRLSS